jgi:hypothetical protein
MWPLGRGGGGSLEMITDGGQRVGTSLEASISGNHLASVCDESVGLSSKYD